MILAENPAAFEDRFGFAPDFGPYEGRLSNQGERLTLRQQDGDLVDEVDYEVRFPWPLGSAGDGSSMELLHPSLDNDLGGSWRASGYEPGDVVPPRYFISPQSSSWRYRKGRSEASNPRDLWRAVDFVEDGSWITGQTSIGYGDGDDNTTLDDMRNNYWSLYLRHSFEIESEDDFPIVLKLRAYVDDGCVVYLNGVEVGRFSVPSGELAFDDLADNHEATWEEAEILDPGSILRVGENVLAIHALNSSTGSSDFSIDAAMLVPGSDGFRLGPPTPGSLNSVYTENSPPAIRQVDHLPRQPLPDRLIPIYAKVSDPDGVASVKLLYQIVEPGSFIPAFPPLTPRNASRESESRPGKESGLRERRELDRGRDVRRRRRNRQRGG